ncbi:glycine--tRNA ligase subunit beta [Campylobacter sp.]|uniref:glycine--tRNA ligase subunit beta n=1 Tax=Campylobacter sp. TaxID=205 RepID=UPI0026DB5074|nr:glycine--tRNA ligase subunit beta [Campylobacter sp.]MDO4674156.1 glycine--tRNA ligase subunit beta [Campylobacter sp.]
MSELLIEIGTEELPALPLLKELKNIRTKWEKILEENHLKSAFDFYFTPRRLVFYHKNFAPKQEDSLIEIIGAPKDVAYKDGVLSPAGMSFLQKTGLSEDALEFKTIKGREVLYCQKKLEGRPSEELLPMMIESLLKSLNFGKSMRWGAYPFEFIRAIRSLVCILDDALVAFESYGVRSAKKTFVHRCVSYAGLEFKNAEEYFEILEQNFVILSPEKRRAKILGELALIEKSHALSIADDPELLDELVAITEYPTALLGGFREEFLQIPSEVIITSMRENQRYFAVFNQSELSNHFVLITNAVCEDYAQVIHGNERVLSARLSDAAFFYENDLRQGLKPEKLSKMLYLDGLGTMADKIEREKELALLLCEFLRNDKKEAIKEAVRFSKADLATQMVYEFTNLQGVMGGYYAEKMGLSYEICLAIKEQYLPTCEHSALPSTEFSSILALANKFDTLLALFSIGKIPTGTKDPYALRRAAVGVLKILLHLKKSFDLKRFLEQASRHYRDFDWGLLENFILERMHTLYAANASFIKAALASKNSDLIHINAAILALMELSQKANFSENFSTFKRLANIATPKDTPIRTELFESEAEEELFEAFKQSLKTQNIKQRLENLFALKPLIDDFFEKVMINSDDAGLKNNRQALIFAIYNEFLKIADIKELRL